MIKFKRITILCISAFLIFIACWLGFYLYNDGEITLQWNSNREADLAGYQVHYGTASGTYTHSILIGLASQPQTGTTSYKLNGLVKGQKYYISVTAYNQYGYESAYSNEVEGYAR